jgi:hypothetical protein
VKPAEAGILVQCQCPGLPGPEDPRITKAVRAAKKDRTLRADIERMRAFDGRHLAAIEQIALPPAFLTKLAAAHAAGPRRPSGKAVLFHPIGLAIVIGALVLLGWGGLTFWDHEHSFTGKDNVMRIVEVNDQMTGMELEPKKEPAGELGDWFFDKYAFEDYYVPPGFENYQTLGARLFRQDDEPVAQVAVDQNNMIFFCFKAQDFGVALPADDQWRVFRDGDWVAAIQQHEEECFMVTFRGSTGDMDQFLNSRK